MIKNIDGDLLLATEHIIGHQVNCMGVMGAGVAMAIREKHEKAHVHYMVYCQTKISRDLLGDCQIVKIDETRYVANLFGQEFFGGNGQYTNYNALRNSLELLKDFATNYHLSVALPYKIGSDRGGGNWDVVYKIIDEVFSDYEVTLYKY